MGRGRALVHAGRAGRHGRRERADPGADGVPFVRRVEALAVRTTARAWAGRGAVLHPAEDRDVALAELAARSRAVRDADDEIARERRSSRPAGGCARIGFLPRGRSSVG